jgi:hypothetical protein
MRNPGYPLRSRRYWKERTAWARRNALGASTEKSGPPLPNLLPRLRPERGHVGFAAHG